MGSNYNEKIYTVDESATHPGKYRLVFHPDKFRCISTDGSYLVMGARILDIGYVDFLRLCRDSFDAELYGKNTLYPVVVFPNRAKVGLLCDTLNAFANAILLEVDEYEREMQDEDNVSDAE